jgi:Zn-finger nucleic acid-binding protein
LIKAGLSNSFVGDFSTSYAPLFMVNPLADLSSGSRLLQTHPPVKERVTVLAEMAHKKPEELVDDIRTGERRRESARTVIRPRAQASSGDEGASGPVGAPAVTAAGEAPEAGNAHPERVWLIRTAVNAWEGPLTMEELIGHPRFYSFAMVSNAQERIEAKAREFPQIRTAMRKISAGKGTSGNAGDHRCPRCNAVLADSVYEGVPVMNCPSCGGRLVGMGGMDRILIRKETSFSEGFREKAGECRTEVKHGPPPVDGPSRKGPAGKAACPCCGRPMIERPFNYEYFVPVDKCLSCCKIWFDPDELELLQYLVESRAKRAGA